MFVPVQELHSKNPIVLVELRVLYPTIKFPFSLFRFFLSRLNPMRLLDFSFPTKPDRTSRMNHQRCQRQAYPTAYSHFATTITQLKTEELSHS